MFHVHQSTPASPTVLNAGCNVYISEGRNTAALKHLQDSACRQEAKLITSFIDVAYNRSSYTFASTEPIKILHSVVALVKQALELLDLRHHEGTHPRLGLVDHISCHPVMKPTGDQDNHLRTSADLARSLAQELSAPSCPCPLPIYLYGAAREDHRSLAEIRRHLGYFKGTQGKLWSGSLPLVDLSANPPDYGPLRVPERGGLLCIGAVPWVVNYNVLLSTQDLQAGREVARGVSGRYGGLQGVEAMALEHQDGVEVACNLLDYWGCPPARVLKHMRELADKRGLQVMGDYVIGLLPEDIEAKVMS